MYRRSSGHLAIKGFDPFYDRVEEQCDRFVTLSTSVLVPVMKRLLDHYQCPITHELTVFPVFAGDGVVYEESAINGWIAEGNGKSPCTNVPMDSRLVPSLQTVQALTT